MTQSDLSRKSGLSRAAISALINGTRGPGIESCQKIARALGLPLDEVYRAAGLMPPAPDKNELIERISHEIDSLPKDEQESIEEYIKLRIRLWRKKKNSR